MQPSWCKNIAVLTWLVTYNNTSYHPQYIFAWYKIYLCVQEILPTIFFRRCQIKKLLQKVLHEVHAI